MPPSLLTLNGIDAVSGRYLLPPMTRSQLAARLRRRRVVERPMARGLIGDPLDVASAGWGALFAADTDPAVRRALAPLLALRRSQAQRRDPRRFRTAQLSSGETKAAFLARHGVGRGPVDPRRMPYYLLLIGDLDEIPQRFQAELAAQHAVGRLAFDTPEEYGRYAMAVLAADGGETPRDRIVELVGPRNADDRATSISSDRLLTPLAARLEEQDGWRVRLHVAGAASRACYRTILSDPDRAALFFSASHCLGFPCGHPRQATDQGAILCQDWPGPQRWHGEIARDHYLAAADLDDATIDGQVFFLFGCFSAGTPRFDDFARDDKATPLAPRACLAPLVKRLLSHPRGAALAVIGHIDRAWTYSFHWGGIEQLAVFEATLARLFAGHPVGHALEYFRQRYGELAVELAATRTGGETEPDTSERIALWMAATDARNHTLVGDPAVRLSLPA